MTTKEALTIMNLKENFTAKELKQSYRSLAKKLHPDQFKSNTLEAKEAEEKLKKINEAYALLFDKSKSISVSEEVLRYQDSKILEFEKYKFSKYKDKFPKYNNTINDIIQTYKTSLCITVEDVKWEYYKALNKIEKLYEQFADEFSDSNNIFITESLRIYIPFDEFYEQLLKIKEKRIKEIQTYKDKLYALIISKFSQNNVVYDVANKEIEAIIEEYSEKFYNKPYNQRIKEENINTLTKRISEIIEKTRNLTQEIEDLEEEVHQSNNNDIVTSYFTLKTLFYIGSRFNVIEDKIDELKREIEINKGINIIRIMMHEKSIEFRSVLSDSYDEIISYLYSTDIKSLQQNIPDILELLNKKDYANIVLLIEKNLKSKKDSDGHKTVKNS